jgi:hypothetical protein
VQQLTLTGPDGHVIAQYTAPALANDMAQYTSKAGRKRPEGEWPHGTYRATYRIERSGVSLIEKTFELQLSGVQPNRQADKSSVLCQRGCEVTSGLKHLLIAAFVALGSSTLAMPVHPLPPFCSQRTNQRR